MRIPELKKLNPREGEMIGLEQALEDFVQRQSNSSLLRASDVAAGLAGGAIAETAKTLKGIAVGLAFRAIRDPKIKSWIANAMYKASKKIPSKIPGGSFLKLLTPASRISPPTSPTYQQNSTPPII